MIIYPAIDLRDGKCVRLYQGDYQKEIIYAADPLVQIEDFVRDGATWLHLIDLDGAKNPKKNQEALILKLLYQQSIAVQVGGGIRSFSQIDKYLENGASRVIIGSLAVFDPEMVLAWFQYFGSERLVLAMDVVYDKKNNPLIATNAWQKTSHKTPYALLATYQEVGLKHVLCTDITRDGTLNGPSTCLYESLLTQFPQLQIQASGGIRSLSDLAILREMGCMGAITGRALYEKQFTLNEALSC